MQKSPLKIVVVVKTATKLTDNCHYCADQCMVYPNVY